MAEYKGIDVSKYQGNIDWPKVKASGINFAIIRATLGSYTKDPYVDINAKGAQAAGIDFGFYHYFWSKTVAEAKAEARFFLDVIMPYRPTYPVVVDVEEKAIAGAGKSAITAATAAFCEALEFAGYYAMIYANKDWLTNKLDYEKIKRYDIWLAEWVAAPTWGMPFGIWQYSSTGQVNGISGNVDMNICYKDYPTIIKAAGLNGFTKPAAPAPAPAPSPTPAPTTVAETVHVVSKGETLSGIAKKYGTTYQALAAYNGIANPNIIYAGQRIKIPGKVASTLAPSVTVGSRVKITGSNYATGQAIPQWVKSATHIVSQISGDRALLGSPGGINSWVKLTDIQII